MQLQPTPISKHFAIPEDISYYGQRNKWPLTEKLQCHIQTSTIWQRRRTCCSCFSSIINVVIGAGVNLLR